MVSLPIGPHMTLSPIEGAMTRGVDPVLKVGGGGTGDQFIYKYMYVFFMYVYNFNI